MQITEKQYLILSDLCDTFIPSVNKTDDPDGYWRRKPSECGVPDKILEIIGNLPDSDQRDFQKLLVVLSVPILGMSWGGPMRSFDELVPAQRERMLLRWSLSLVSDLRDAFNKLRKICGLIYFGHAPAGHPNPNWASIRYPGPLTLPTTERSSLLLYALNGLDELHCDVVVVGSGAGGSVVASVLAEAGYQVIVVEKGAYADAKSHTGRELDIMQHLYEGSGLVTSNDGGVMFLAGSSVGGGTSVNWNAAMRTPDYILGEWAEQHGNPHFTTAAYAKGFDQIEARCHVTSEVRRHNPQNEALLEAAGRLDYRSEVIPRNIQYPDSLDADLAWKAEGYACLGDACGIQQSAARTFLMDATAKGARILAETFVDQVIVEKGEAVGLACRTVKDGRQRNLTIRARRVVVASGALHTPVLLMKSGLRHSEIGNNLFVHPAVPVPGLYQDRMEGWYGPMMSVVCEEFARLNGNYGFRIETPPLHPGFMALAMSWESGEKYKSELLHAANYGAFFVLVRDKIGGRIRVNKDGMPDITYKLSNFDKKHLVRGIQECVRLHHAAGAQRVTVLHNQPAHFYSAIHNIEHFVNKIPNLKWDINYFSLFSAHQMGTCRMGGDDKKHPVKPNGETREARHLFIADSSLFPSAAGVNPMLSIQTLAWYVAQEVKAGLS